MTMRSYTMTSPVLKRLKHNRNVQTLVCHHPSCRKPIKVGQQVVSKESKHKTHGYGHNIYHRQCYLDSFIEVT